MSHPPPKNSPPLCPFIGLIPFDEARAEYFFGRERDTEIIVTNLRASRLTILYGSSGVGKSSVIRAGVVPYLRRASEISAIPGEPPDFLYVIIREWVNDPVLSLKAGINQAVEYAVKNGAIPDLTQDDVSACASKNKDNRDIATVIREWTDLIKTKFLFVFDQFEDFFTHSEFMSGAGSFGEGLPLAINDEKVSANYLISMRDDSISKLDFFRGRLGPLIIWTKRSPKRPFENRSKNIIKIPGGTLRSKTVLSPK